MPATDTPTRATYHHIGIQCTDLDNAARWYGDFLEFSVAWSLTEFSPLTRTRLPGITELRELVAGGTRLHLFERAGAPAPDPSVSRTQFQHLCFATSSPEELRALRERWIRLHGSGDYVFALAEQPTEIVTDAEGIESFYAYDVNGLELEFTFEPSAEARP